MQQPRADFRTSLNYVLEHEGYYSNHSSDAGGETYCGISRVFNCDWVGWKYIDQYKRSHQVNQNDSIPNMQWWVDFYYVDIWVKEDFYSIVNQDVANYALDFRINATIGPLIINRTLNKMGYDVQKINQVTPLTIVSLNQVDNSWELLCRLMGSRIDFYTNIVDKRPDQIVFLNHWIKRVKV